MRTRVSYLFSFFQRKEEALITRSFFPAHRYEHDGKAQKGDDGSEDQHRQQTEDIKKESAAQIADYVSDAESRYGGDRLGTDAVLCTFGQMTWVKHWLQTYSTLSETDHVVVPDIRKDFEAEALLKLGGIIIEVRRGTGLAGETGKHTSESGLETVLPHYVIDNHGTVDELCRMVDSIMKEL